MRIGILTSTDIRHRFFVNAVRAKFPVVAVGYEETGYEPATDIGGELNADERRIVERHFAERARQELAFFGHDCEFVQDGPEVGVLRITPGRLNSRVTLECFVAHNVDTVLVYGTNLIRQPLISKWEGRMLNMHLGLSPYYRGTATNFYPLVNGEPQYVGATIHQIDAGIDSGPIVRHSRPTISVGDLPHTVGCKAILAGIDAMMKTLFELSRDGRVKSEPQWEVAGARLYLRRDYDPRHVVELYKKIDAGLIDRYARNPEESGSKLRLIE